MRRLVLVFLAACAGAQTTQTGVEPAKPITVTPAAQQAPQLDEAAVKARTHAWLDTFDRFDVQGFVEPLGSTFVLFEEGNAMDQAFMVKALQRRKDRHQSIVSRTWKEERVMIGDGVAVFIGNAVEHVPAFEDNKAYDQEGWNTVVWVREGGRWVVAHWGWQLAGTEAESRRWNEVFRNASGFNKKPNQLLVDAVKGKKPGTALDIMMGQGRNALFLAAQGWKTTGVDISDEGIKQAQAEAAKQKLKLDAQLADIDKYDLGTAKWDLVTLIYAGDRAELVERIKPSLKKGGLFVCEYFHNESDPAKAGAGGWDTGELAALFKDGFKILRDETVEDNADWAGQRKTKLVRFVAQKL